VRIKRDYGPRAKIGGGIALISLGIAMFYFQTAFVWFGSFVWGGILIYLCYRQDRGG